MAARIKHVMALRGLIRLVLMMLVIQEISRTMYVPMVLVKMHFLNLNTNKMKMTKFHQLKEKLSDSSGLNAIKPQMIKLNDLFLKGAMSSVVTNVDCSNGNCSNSNCSQYSNPSNSSCSNNVCSTIGMTNNECQNNACFPRED